MGRIDASFDPSLFSHLIQMQTRLFLELADFIGQLLCPKCCHDVIDIWCYEPEFKEKCGLVTTQSPKNVIPMQQITTFTSLHKLLFILTLFFFTSHCLLIQCTCYLSSSVAWPWQMSFIFFIFHIRPLNVGQSSVYVAKIIKNQAGNT